MDIECPVLDIKAILSQYKERTQLHIAARVFADLAGIDCTPRQALTYVGGKYRKPGSERLRVVPSETA